MWRVGGWGADGDMRWRWLLARSWLLRCSSRVGSGPSIGRCPSASRVCPCRLRTARPGKWSPGTTRLRTTLGTRMRWIWSGWTLPPPAPRGAGTGIGTNWLPWGETVSRCGPRLPTLLCHLFPASGLSRGDMVLEGDLLGTVAPEFFAGNNGLAHIHYALHNHFRFWTADRSVHGTVRARRLEPPRHG